MKFLITSAFFCVIFIAGTNGKYVGNKGKFSRISEFSLLYEYFFFQNQVKGTPVIKMTKHTFEIQMIVLHFYNVSLMENMQKDLVQVQVDFTSVTVIKSVLPRKRLCVPNLDLDMFKLMPL